jgi:histidine triad (HIT) family protein
MTTNCIFCDITFGRAPATVVKKWYDATAIVPLNPVTPGHLIVIPVKHVADTLEDPKITAKTMRRAAQIAQGPCNIITSVGREATQSVFHLHIHIVPRSKDDGLALPWYSGKGNH